MNGVIDVCEKTKMFASDDVRRMYVTISVVRDWQQKTGGTLDELLEYMEKTFAKKEA